MRISVRRTVVGCYIMFCAGLSFLNYRYSSFYYYGSRSWGGDNVNDENARPEDHPGAQPISPESWSAAFQAVDENNRGAAGRRFDVMNDDKAESYLSQLWPEDTNNSDRILAQMNFIPAQTPNTTFVIYLPQGYGSWNVHSGATEFAQCPVSNCEIADHAGVADTADAVMFRNTLHDLGAKPRPPHQIWILYALESPENTYGYGRFAGQVNWTATYRRQSDIVTPYEKFVAYSEAPKYPNLRNRFRIEGTPTKRNKTDFAAGKNKKVAWFVSNCYTSNQRLKFAQELQKYIEVDIYGGCGKLTCARFNSECFALLNRDYKFYLAFENSNCRDYVTEKFFVNGLQNDVIPIVMGAHPDDYRAFAPPHSFIHVEDFPTIKALADYLHKLDQNDSLYNEYFRWKGTGEFINTKFWCRLCALMNSQRPKVYADVEDWWRSGICRNNRWDGGPGPVASDESENAAVSSVGPIVEPVPEQPFTSKRGTQR